MGLFSERYGYKEPSDILIREEITLEVQNAICNCFDSLKKRLASTYFTIDYSQDFEKFLWLYFLNKRESEFKKGGRYNIVSTVFIEDSLKEWNEKLDLVEFSIKYLDSTYPYKKFTQFFTDHLNSEFKRLNFAYRVINKEIVEVSSEEEIVAIREALQSNQSNIQLHLNNALELYAKKPNGDYRNSIKESISAVEVFCREKTGEDTLGKALSKLESSGIVIPKLLKQAFDKLYAYTNQNDTGIRHALMDDEGTYTPQAEETLFMLVSCCSFINYLNKKVS